MTLPEGRCSLLLAVAGPVLPLAHPGMDKVVTAILGGGQGSRLWPLTQHRAKPAVPVGGKFRLIDVPISNSLHAGIDRIHVITQFNSVSLNRHCAEAYRFDSFRGGYVNILAAEQTIENRDWYQGTADAVRQNLSSICENNPRDVLVLSGDQLYLMDVRAFVWRHRKKKADLTVAVTPVTREQATAFGIMRLAPDGRIVEFVEKPKDPKQLDELTPSAETLCNLGFKAPPGSLIASMGMYVFRRSVLDMTLRGTSDTDFGGEVIPKAIGELNVHAFPHNGYWRDIGTIPAFHEASLDLTRPLPPLNLYSRDRPIFTHPRFLPGTKINQCEVLQSILCEGSIISRSTIHNSIIGIRAIVQAGCSIESSIVMGARSFEPERPPSGMPFMGIGSGTEIRNAIVDLDARIGPNCKLVNKDNVDTLDADNFCIRGGVIVVPRGAVIEPGTEV